MKNILKLNLVILIGLIVASCQKDDVIAKNEITSVSLTGQKTQGSQLLAIYKVSGNVDDIAIKWWRADDNKGKNESLIDNETNINYLLKSNDVGKYIRVEVTMKSNSSSIKFSEYAGPILPQTLDEGVFASSIDKLLFSQIKLVGDTFEEEPIWESYKFKEYSMYLLHKNQDGSVDRGFVINPKTEILNAQRLSVADSEGITVYRYDAKLQDAFDVLNSGNGLYDFYYSIDDNESYYLQVYTDQEVENGSEPFKVPQNIFDTEAYNFSAISFMAHEVFHQYQEDDWEYTGSIIKIWPSSEQLELRLLLHELFSDFPNIAQTPTLVEKKLKQYLAIREHEIEISSYDYLSPSEHGEGTAEYVESMVVRKVFPKRANEVFQAVSNSIDLDYPFANRDEFTFVLDQLHYDIGASICFGISTINNDLLESLERGKTPFEVVKELFNITTQEQDVLLESAKAEVDWIKIQQKAAELSALK